jgi:hypothetical protein
VAFTVALALYVFSGWNPDVRFESSDGIWHDGTSHFKGRGLDAIRSNFETYQRVCKRPAVTLVRTTPEESWNLVAWYWYLSAPEWRIPWGPQRTCLHKRCAFSGFPDCTGSDKLVLPPRES